MNFPYVILLSSMFFIGCSSLNSYLGLPDDNLAEETVEAALKYETGVDVDLTPNSKER